MQFTKNLLASLFMTLVLGFIFAGNANAQPPSCGSYANSISGRITEQQIGRDPLIGVANISVQIQRQDGTGSIETVYTDLDGYFNFYGMFCTQYVVTPQPNLIYDSFTPTNRLAYTGNSASQSVNFTAIQPFCSNPNTTTIQGYIYRGYTQLPESGVYIELLDQNLTVVVAVGQTGSAGWFSFTGLDPCTTYFVRPYKAGHYFTTPNSFYVNTGDSWAGDGSYVINAVE
jgi:hypothetical protein